MSSGNNDLDMKSVTVYVAVAVGAVFLIELAAYLSGALDRDSSSKVRYILFALLFVVPSLAALLSRRCAGDTNESRPDYWPLSWKMFWLIAVGVPAVCLVTNVVEAALGWTSLDLSFERVVTQMPEGSEIPPSSLLTLAIMLDFVLMAAVYSPIFLAYEYGWRVHFQGRLKSLGRLKAYAITGLLSGVCFVPIVFSEVIYIAHPPIAAARVLLIVAILGAISGEILRIGGNATMCAVFAGTFFSQTVGTIDTIFPLRRLDFGGPFGWLSIVMWAFVLVAVSRLPAKRQSE
jgi:hypothetical protein